VIHGYTETTEGLSAFRGSKYVQSIIGDTYRQAGTFLEQGRKVLFSGTPCQIAGLKAFLQKDYENLLTVDLVCHGVPSPAVWQKYLDEITPPYNAIESISFRNKTYGWKVFSLAIQFIGETNMKDKSNITDINFRNKIGGWKNYYFSAKDGEAFSFIETLHKNSFMKGFLCNLYLRPSCYRCPVRFLRSGSDITIGDYWGIQNVLPEFDDDKGTSLVMVNTAKGRALYDQVHTDSIETSYEDAAAGNQNIEKSALVNPKRSVFFRDWHTKEVTVLINELTRITFYRRVQNRIRAIIARVLRKIGLLGFVKSILKK
jgi:coenzyme F420-reducing hydrogenase beta subunit